MPHRLSDPCGIVHVQPVVPQTTECMTNTHNAVLSQRQLLDRARRACFPRHDGWRVVAQRDTGVRLRRNGPVAQVAHLGAVDPTDLDPERAVFATLGRLVITWEDPPGLGLVLVLPDHPSWRSAAAQLTVRPSRLFGVQYLTVDASPTGRGVTPLDLWGTTWFGRTSE